MKTKEEILTEIYGEGADLSDKSKPANMTIGAVMQAMERYNFENRIVVVSEHCICTADQYGAAINPKCLIHGE